jgi:hypothetical protein
MANPTVICDARSTEDGTSAPADDLIYDAAPPSDAASSPICAAPGNVAASPPCATAVTDSAAIASDALIGTAHMKAISVSNSKTCLLAFETSSCLLANCYK